MIKSPYELPEFVAALHRESIQRVIAFHPVTHQIAGFPVTPLTLRQYSLLRLADSPFLPQFETPSPQQLIQFMWILNPHFCTGSSPEKKEFFARARGMFVPPPPPRWWAKIFTTIWYFKRKGCELREAVAAKEAREFMADMLADRPEMGTEYAPSYYSDECNIIGTLAKEHGWDAQSIMAMPVQQIFQCLKQIRETLCTESGTPALLSNPSDEVIQRHLSEANKKN